ncbi:Prolyl tripeptidyl peptidase precursor [Gemmata sp. SH-PL17]|uniref:S9 family peptidase n=1 Tax=Gemmata sp. SH-PL17 TaxID=1630693 RepID=UPI00078CBB1B|nr:S9 family peptidase [Gemmata sp. SH-PL17]AMV23907.1 Prolyl tripeptidyl peptidase precursor [Gemmata sp. SH-PL17]
MFRFAFFAGVFAMTPLVASAEAPPLIPRDVLFGNPDKAGPQISPDGKHIAYLAPDEKNVLQVWVRTTALPAGKANDKKVTSDEKRGIRQYFWAHDGKHLLYLQDAGGDENFHLFAAEFDTGKTRDLTPFTGVRVQGVELDEKHPDTLLVGMNKRNKAAFDMHRVTISTGEEKIDTENPGLVVGWTTDKDFVIRAATAVNSETGGYDLMVREKPGAEWKTIKKWTNEEQGQAAGFGADANTLYVIGNDSTDTLRLTKFDLATSKEEVIAEDKEYDIGGAMIDDKKRIPLAVSFAKARTEWKVLDDSVKDDFAALAKVRRGDFSVTSKTTDDTLWVVAYVTDDGPVSYYLYHRDTKKADFLFFNNSKLENTKLAQMEPIQYKAKDGLVVHGYLTKPLGVEAKDLPTVLLVHGGPWARDSWGFSPLTQFLANRGYAVLQVNFRGSTGYGKKFLNAGNREWAGKMHQDLIDAKEWIVKQGVADPKKVAIMGGSYGGYATLVGLTFTPDEFACGVDIVGPSNIVTLLKTVPPYWAPAKALFAKRVGDLEKEEAFLKERSPLAKVNYITKPLLIGQGKNDPRVKVAESDQIVDAMRKNGKPVEYVLYPDEGHGFQRPENRLHFFAITEQFLAKHLGGRAEAVGEIKGHSGEIK